MVTTMPAKNGTRSETTSNTMAKKEKPEKPAKGGAAARAAETVSDRLSDGNAHLKTALQQIEKQFGPGSIMALGSESAVQIEGIPTGSLSLDIALGGQGIPRGRIVEVFGPESSGKTTLALHVAAQRKKRGDRGDHRRRTRVRSDLGQEVGRGIGDAPGQPADLG